MFHFQSQKDVNLVLISSKSEPENKEATAQIKVKTKLLKRWRKCFEFSDLKPSIFYLIFVNKSLCAAYIYAIDHSKSNSLILAWLFLNLCFRNLENKNLLDSLIPTDSRIGREASKLNCLIWVQGEIRSRNRLYFLLSKE